MSQVWMLHGAGKMEDEAATGIGPRSNGVLAMQKLQASTV